MRKKYSREKKHRTGEIPTGSFSDIAFLLIIYFLVATTLVKVKSITADLPSGEKAAQTHAQTGALDQIGVTRPSWSSLLQTLHKAPAARWPLPEGTDGEWADGWARSRSTASTPDALQTGSRSMLS